MEVSPHSTLLQHMEVQRLVTCRVQERRRSMEECFLDKEDKDWRVWLHSKGLREERRCKNMLDMLRRRVEILLLL